jgi:hypothetical protein
MRERVRSLLTNLNRHGFRTECYEKTLGNITRHRHRDYWIGARLSNDSTTNLPNPRRWVQTGPGWLENLSVEVKT